MTNKLFKQIQQIRIYKGLASSNYCFSVAVSGNMIYETTNGYYPARYSLYDNKTYLYHNMHADFGRL